MTDLCPKCGAYWQCDCEDESGVYMDADGLGGEIRSPITKPLTKEEVDEAIPPWLRPQLTVGGADFVDAVAPPSLTVDHLESVRDEFRQRFGNV